MDASAVALFLTQGRMAARTIQRAILGLPIMFFFKSIHADLIARGVDSREARRKASATVSPSRGLGRASPLFFRVVPLAGPTAGYVVLMGLFRSRLLPDYEMTVKPGDFSIPPTRVDVPADFSLYRSLVRLCPGAARRAPRRRVILSGARSMVQLMRAFFLVLRPGPV